MGLCRFPWQPSALTREARERKLRRVWSEYRWAQPERARIRSIYRWRWVGVGMALGWRFADGQYRDIHP